MNWLSFVFQSILLIYVCNVEGRRRKTKRNVSLFNQLNTINGISNISQRGLKFSYSNCGKASDPLQLDSLIVGPDPVRIPGNITLAAKGKIAKPLTSPIKLELTIKKKVFFWVEIPCIDNVGSCTYDDICDMVKSFPCPEEFKKAGIPCQCPVKAGKYTLPKSEVAIPNLDIPATLEKGDYQIEAKLSIANIQLGCLHMSISLAHGEKKTH